MESRLPALAAVAKGRSAIRTATMGARLRGFETKPAPSPNEGAGRGADVSGGLHPVCRSDARSGQKTAQRRATGSSRRMAEGFWESSMAR